MTALFVACRLVLAATFLVALTSKFVSGGNELDNALRLSVPRLLARAATVAVIPLEFAVAALLLLGETMTFEAGLVAAVCLLIVFSGWTLSVLLRGLQVQCSCFGPKGAAVGWRQLARNGLLIAIALTGLVVTPSRSDGVGTSVWSGLTLVGGALLIMFAIAVRRAIPALVLSFDQVRETLNPRGEDVYAG